MNGTPTSTSAARARTSTRRAAEPIVLLQFTNKGADRFEEITRARGPARPPALQHARGRAQGDTLAYLQHFAIVLDREIKSFPSIDFGDNPGGISGNGAPDHRHGEPAGGEGPRARPADRRAPGRVPHARPDRDLGDARQGLAEGGEAARRSSACSPSRCSSSIVYRFLGLVAVIGARDLRRLPVRRDPALQRHAHAPGHRRPRADARCRRRRERRHLRTHQGRGARRALRARRDLDRLHQGLRARSSTRTWSPRSRRWCSSRSRPRASAASR